MGGGGGGGGSGNCLLDHWRFDAGIHHKQWHCLEPMQLDTGCLPIAIGLWLMMRPALCNGRYEQLWSLLVQKGVWQQLLLPQALELADWSTVMTGHAWATLPELPGYRAGVIMKLPGAWLWFLFEISWLEAIQNFVQFWWL